MFASHFSFQTELLRRSSEKNLKKRGAPAPEKKKDPKILYSGFYTFLREHLPAEFSLTPSKVRSNSQILKKACDALIYKGWCGRYLDMTGGYVLIKDLYAFLSLESSLESGKLREHVGLTRALKSLYASQINGKQNTIIPLYSILFSYGSTQSLLQTKQSLVKIVDQKEVPLNCQLDMICVLGKGIIIKDWETAGSYRGIQTGQDTLMWFYILLMEYLDREGSMQLGLREYVKSKRSYSEF